MTTEWTTETKYGLLDMVDNCWLGDETGPKLFDELWVARIAAQVADERLGYAPGRTRAIPYMEGPVRLKDQVDTKMSALEALQKLEDGD